MSGFRWHFRNLRQRFVVRYFQARILLSFDEECDCILRLRIDCSHCQIFRDVREVAPIPSSRMPGFRWHFRDLRQRFVVRNFQARILLSLDKECDRILFLCINRRHSHVPGNSSELSHIPYTVISRLCGHSRQIFERITVGNTAGCHGLPIGDKVNLQNFGRIDG